MTAMDHHRAQDPMRVALAGFGTVGQELARRLAAGAIPKVRLVAISARDLDKARANSAGLEPRPLVVPVAELPRHADVVVECATGEALPEIAKATLEAGKVLVPVSVGGIAARPEILDLAQRHGGRIKVATGALPGLDAIRVAAEGGIRSLTLISRIRPDSLVREAYVVERGFDFTKPLEAPVKVFAGSAREAALAFPKHFNVAVTLALAGIGFERTRIEVWAEAGLPGAIHKVVVEADDIELELQSRNRPSATNPRTSRAVAPSILAALRSLVAPVQIGS
jgi:aspartate dehydrogenase